MSGLLHNTVNTLKEHAAYCKDRYTPKTYVMGREDGLQWAVHEIQAVMGAGRQYQPEKNIPAQEHFSKNTEETAENLSNITEREQFYGALIEKLMACVPENSCNGCESAYVNAVDIINKSQKDRRYG